MLLCCSPGVVLCCVVAQRRAVLLRRVDCVVLQQAATTPDMLLSCCLSLCAAGLEWCGCSFVAVGAGGGVSSLVSVHALCLGVIHLCYDVQGCPE